ncbi:transcription factor BIM2 isoform X2 [Carica papaya]|nr:transcription factor BIM2 isoform X2 [Carica papaya]XP_021912296.1 transcription factor BIM2 isoform X2 [Carica papaya]
MRTEKGNPEEDEYEDEEFGSKKEGPSSNAPATAVNNNNNNKNKDGKNNDRANAMRSKHSVTEQRRRSKINERFQILRDLIPHSDQKKDTASFLLEVIEYVHYLQEKLQKYEGSYQGWSPEPTKLVPWRNSHWRVQNLVNHPQSIKNGSGPGSTYTGKFEENNITIAPSMLTGSQNPLEPDANRDVACKVMDRQPELASKGVALPMPLQANMAAQGDCVPAHPLQRPVSDAQTSECVSSDSLSQEELNIEGGTINISSVYSQGLLSTVTQALQNAA